MIAGKLLSNLHAQEVIGDVWLFVFKGVRKKKKRLKDRKENTDTLYPPEYTVLPPRYPLSGFLVFCI